MNKVSWGALFLLLWCAIAFTVASTSMVNVPVVLLFNNLLISWLRQVEVGFGV